MLFVGNWLMVAVLTCLAVVQRTSSAPEPGRLIRILPIDEQQYKSILQATLGVASLMPEQRRLNDEQPGSGTTTTTTTTTTLKNHLQKSIGSTWQTLLNRTGLLAYRQPTAPLPKTSNEAGSFPAGYPLCVIKTGELGRAEQQRDDQRPIVNCVVVTAAAAKPLGELEFLSSEQNLDENPEETQDSEEPQQVDDVQTVAEGSLTSDEVPEEDEPSQTEKPSAETNDITDQPSAEKESWTVARLPTPYYSSYSPYSYPYGIRYGYRNALPYHPGYAGYTGYPGYPGYPAHIASIMGSPFSPAASSSTRDSSRNAPPFGFSPLSPATSPFNAYPSPYPMPTLGYPGGVYNPYQPAGFSAYFGPTIPPPLQPPPRHQQPPGFPPYFPNPSQPAWLLPRYNPLKSVGLKAVFNGQVRLPEAEQAAQQEGAASKNQNHKEQDV